MTATQCSHTRGHPDKLNQWTLAKLIVQRQIFAAAANTHTHTYTAVLKPLYMQWAHCPRHPPYIWRWNGGFSPERDGPVALEQVMQYADCTAPRRERKRMEGGRKKMRERVGGTDVKGYVPHWGNSMRGKFSHCIISPCSPNHTLFSPAKSLEWFSPMDIF